MFVMKSTKTMCEQAKRQGRPCRWDREKKRNNCGVVIFEVVNFLRKEIIVNLKDKEHSTVDWLQIKTHTQTMQLFDLYDSLLEYVTPGPQCIVLFLFLTIDMFCGRPLP